MSRFELSGDKWGWVAMVPWARHMYLQICLWIENCSGCWGMKSSAHTALQCGPEKTIKVEAVEEHNEWSRASVIVQISFQRFLNLGNPWKPVKTRELGNMDTHVPFLGNLTKSHMVGTVETYRNLRNLTGKKILCTSGREKWLLSKSVRYPEEIS